MASVTTYESFGSVYGNTKDKIAIIESALKLGGLDIAYNDDEQSGTIIMAVVTETDENNLIAGETAPEAVAEPVLVTDDSETTEDSTDTSTETSNE